MGGWVFTTYLRELLPCMDVDFYGVCGGMGLVDFYYVCVDGFLLHVYSDGTLF